MYSALSSQNYAHKSFTHVKIMCNIIIPFFLQNSLTSVELNWVDFKSQFDFDWECINMITQ